MNGATLPQPDPACNPAAQSTTLDHANAMLTHLRGLPAGHAHELARAAIAAATYYLRETFGQPHALAVTADLVAPLAAPVDPAPIGEVPAAEAPAVTLH